MPKKLNGIEVPEEKIPDTIRATGEEERPSSALRFRMPGNGGGLSSRTRIDLLILAEAIRLDNEENSLLSNIVRGESPLKKQ
jgi:hypothetical protein